MSFDLSVFQFIHHFAGKLRILDWLGIFLAQYLGYILVLAAVYLILKTRNWQERIYFFSFTALSALLSRGIITEVIRFFYHRPRPFLTLNIEPLIDRSLSGSFPSGHAAAFFALALAIFYLNKKAGYWFLISALAMSVFRIFIGVHWPSDIIVGAVVGLISAVIIKKILPARSSKPQL